MTTATEIVISGPRPLRGRLRLPGCKGISHRALLLAACAHGTTTLTGLAAGDDVRRTRAALQALGVEMRDGGGTLIVEGGGVDALREPSSAIDCGNSGTTMRMVAGLVAGRPFRTILTGDHSLAQRPMARVIEPLRAMGARIQAGGGGDRAPIEIDGGPLAGQQLALAVPSGQVKTSLILAGLQAGGTTEISEPAPSRDHTERMLVALGAPVERIDARTVRVRAGAPSPFALDVPGDPSSAAFFVVAALITPGSHLVIEDVVLNPGRIAYIGVLQRMGAHIEVREREARLGEPVGELEVTAGPLTATEIHAAEPIIDEVPALAVAAAFADGVTEIHDAAELRVKESDRIATLQQELGQLGVGVEMRPDGLVIRGGAPRATTLKSHGDHRIAMAAAVAANAVPGESTIRGWQAVDVSYPGFETALSGLAGNRVVAIDGPSGAGKSTVARKVAECLGMEVLDTGAMYRAVTLAVLERLADPNDPEACAETARSVRVDVGERTVLDGRDVTDEIRGPDVTAAVSAVSAHPAVRSVLVDRQRGWVAERGGGVVEGRDIGTVVFPNATVKAFLTASEDERARRRHAEEAAAARDLPVDAVRHDIDRRDRLDSTRAASPLQPAADAVQIDTTGRAADDVADEIVTRFHAATRDA